MGDGTVISLKNAALAALVTMCATFVLRTAGTLSPTLFTDLAMARIAMVVRLSESTALVLFFVIFLRNYVRGERGPLREATLWAIVGTVVALLPTVKHLLHQLHVYPVESLIWSDHLEPLAPLLGSIAMLGFFIVLRRELDEDWRRDLSSDVRPGAGAAEREQHGPRLVRATTWAAIGSGVFVLLNSIVLVNYFASGEQRWLAESTRPIVELLLYLVAPPSPATWIVALHQPITKDQSASNLLLPPEFLGRIGLLRCLSASFRHAKGPAMPGNIFRCSICLRLTPSRSKDRFRDLPSTPLFSWRPNIKRHRAHAL